MGTKIKICGLTREEDIACVNNLSPDYIGFVFAKSKRQVTLEQAQRLKCLLSPSILSVGVFVNKPLEALLDDTKRGVIDLIQLHGDEDEAYIYALKAKTELPIIKVLRVKDGDHLQKDLKALEGLPIDYILLDKHLENSYGGGGEHFDWRYLEAIKQPYFLAGGISIHNIEEALKNKPYAVDVSSGVETQGIKDPIKIEQIIKKVRQS